jgi:hypothetical protein
MIAVQGAFYAWNRLVGVWYNAGSTSDEAQRVATYRYDGLPALDDAQRYQGFRRTEKLLANRGVGVVYGSDAGGATCLPAGNRYEPTFSA